jgi:selenocysteine lyase/cysteine desulfurase
MVQKLEAYRAEFPVAESCIYMNHAAVSPLSRRVRDAMRGLIEDVHLFGASHWETWMEATAAARQSAARLLGAEPPEVAFLKNTSDGISTFAAGLDWRSGDEVISISAEFPANYYPWAALERRGVKLRLVPEIDGVVSLEALQQAITPRTRVMAVSFVQFLSGYRLDLGELGRVCAERGVLLFVDAIQGLGAFPLDVRQARIAGLAADGHKWMLGPEGCAIFFLRRDLWDRVTPTTIGWTNVRGWGDFSHRPIAWREDAGKFECGAANTAGIYGLGAALDLLLEAGIDRIGERILDLNEHLRSGLAAQGHRLFGPASRDECSGIISFLPRQGSEKTVVQRLKTHRVEVAGRLGKVRISPHFYNTHEEIDRVLELLSA